MNCLVPVEVADAPKGFTNDSFFVIDLPAVSDVLPVAASGAFVIRTVGFLAVGRRFEDLNNAGSSVVLLLSNDLDLDNIARRAPRHKDDALVSACKTSPAVYKLFDFEKHRVFSREAARTSCPAASRLFKSSKTS